MKFFTLAWWSALQPDSTEPYDGPEPFKAYVDYINTIEERLPPGALAVNEAVPLHDAELWNWEYSAAEGRLTFEFEHYNGDMGKDWRFFLEYEGVSSLRSLADPNLGLMGPFGYGALGYNELDLIADGGFEHRLLFSTGIELHIRCRDVRGWWAEDKIGQSS